MKLRRPLFEEAGSLDTVSAPKIAHITTIDQSLDYLLLNQLQSFQRAGYEVVGIAAPGPHVSRIESAGIRFLPVYMTRNFTPLTDLFSLWQLWRVIRRERFVIVHTHNPKPGLLGQLAARFAGTPVVINTLHGFYFHDHMRPLGRRFYIMLERLAALCSDLILSQNREDMITAKQERIGRPSQMRYLGNGIDLTVFDPGRFSAEAVSQRRAKLNIPVEAPVVGFVGRLAGRRKGFLDFLAAASAIAQQLPEARFLIIGEADHGKPDAVEPSIATDYGIADRCLFLGRQANEDLPLLYCVMDLLVLPSLFEGVPRVVMEAAAMGIPAVVTDVKGNREAVERGRNGLLVPLGDVAALQEAILAILTNREDALRMGAEGRRLAQERFDERLIFAHIRAEYARLLRREGLSPPPTIEEVQGVY